MKTVLGLLVSVALTGVVPAFAQSNAPDDQKQNAPGTGGTSKPGVTGLPGSKSGPATTSSGEPTPSANSRTTKSHDESKVPGLPGSKSGPAVKSPNKDSARPASDEDK